MAGYIGTISNTEDEGREMTVREITAKSILSKSQVYDYALNAFAGCQTAAPDSSLMKSGVPRWSLW